MADTIEKVVTASGWWQKQPHPVQGQPPVGTLRLRGETVQVTQADLDHLEHLGVLETTLADPQTSQGQAAEEGTEPGEIDLTDGGLTDEELASLNAEQTVSYLTQYPDQVDRVESIELSRTTPRKTVTDAIEGIRSAQE